MKYMGSKNRHSKELVPIIESLRTDGMPYIEPFVGGANMIDKIKGLRIGYDLNPYTIGALKCIRDRLKDIPKDNTETNELIYKDMKSSDDIGLAGYYAFALSYGGKFFGGWCRDKAGKRDYVAESYRNAAKQSELLKGVPLLTSDYRDIKFSKPSLIYCDPPYKGTTGYKDGFDHAEFWQWVRDRTSDGHVVLVSEYDAPEDFECIWEKSVNNSLTKDTGSKKAVERLFRLR